MKRAVRWFGGATVLLLVLNLMGQRPTALRRSSWLAPRKVDVAAVTDITTGFLRAALTAPQGVDWTKWTTPQLAEALARYPPAVRPRPVLRTLDIRLLVRGERAVQVFARAELDRSFNGAVALALVLELLLTPNGWRVERIVT